jgi:hypothetical protein
LKYGKDSIHAFTGSGLHPSLLFKIYNNIKKILNPRPGLEPARISLRIPGREKGLFGESGVNFLPFMGFGAATPRFGEGKRKEKDGNQRNPPGT